MSYYLIPYRNIKFKTKIPQHTKGYDVDLTIEFSPEDAFGENCTKRTTFPVGEEISMLFDANTGICKHEGMLIPKTYDSTKIRNIQLTLNGKQLIFQFTCSKSDEFQEIINHIILLLPSTLTVYLGPNFAIKQAFGTVNNIPFRIELSQAFAAITVTTLEKQIENFKTAYNILFSKSMQEVVLINALFYYNQACRFYYDLDGTMSLFAETILNLAKSMEGLFGNQRKQIRIECQKIGLSNDQIEERIIPILLVRNELDVGHVRIRHITQSEVQILQTFMNCAIKDVRDILLKVINVMNNNEYELPLRPKRNNKKDLISAIDGYIERRNKIN